MTQWLYHFLFVIRVADVTANVKRAFANGLANNGSGESADNEERMFNSVQRFSTSGNEPATVVGIACPAKDAMRIPLRNLVQALPEGRFIVTARVPFDGNAENAVIASNWPGLANGTIVTWGDVVERLESQFGLKRIEPEPIGP